jgi:hypothetical protein
MNQKQEGLALKWKLLIVAVVLVGAAEQIALDMALWRSLSVRSVGHPRAAMAGRQRQADSDGDAGVAQH